MLDILAALAYIIDDVDRAGANRAFMCARSFSEQAVFSELHFSHLSYQNL